jgi:hypothetical protein
MQSNDLPLVAGRFAFILPPGRGTANPGEGRDTKGRITEMIETSKIMLNLIAELMALSVIIFAAVAWLKQTGIRGQALTFAAFAFGLVLGIAYRFALAPMVTFADWFWAVCFGLMAGFLATGAYKGAESASGKTMLMAPYEPDPSIYVED